MLAVIGIEIFIERLQGKLEVSQNVDLSDRHGTVSGPLSATCE